MKRKDIVALVKRQIEEKSKLPTLQLSHELIKDNLAIQFEMDKDFKVGRYYIYGNFSTLQEGSLLLAAKKMEQVRATINKFHNDEITVEDFNTMLAAFIKLPVIVEPLKLEETDGK